MKPLVKPRHLVIGIFAAIPLITSGAISYAGWVGKPDSPRVDPAGATGNAGAAGLAGIPGRTRPTGAAGQNGNAGAPGNGGAGIGGAGGQAASTCPDAEPALVFKPGRDVCYRLAPPDQTPGPFQRKLPPSRADREEAERWLLTYPACEGHLNRVISKLEDRIHQSANTPGSTDGNAAACDLRKYKAALASAGIDQHEAYNIIQDELHEEIDYKLWREQIMLGATFLGGAGGARDVGLDLRWDTRKFWPVGFRSSLSIGLHRTSNLLYATNATVLFNDLPTPRDPTIRLSVPMLAGMSWSWIQSSLFLGAGAAWTNNVNAWAFVGQIGIGASQNWVHHGRNDFWGLATELRFVVQPWIPFSSQGGPASIMFGLELGAGFGFLPSPCDLDKPTEAACRPLTTR